MVATSKFEKELRLFAVEINNAAKRVLGRRTIGKNKSYGESSGALRKSLTFDVSKKGKNTKITFGSPLPYAPFIHFGVNGTNRNRQAPFSYKGKQPPIKGILQWMKKKPLRLRDKNGKFVRQTESKLKSAAFMIARSIKRNGIAGLFYYEKAYEAILPKFKARLGEAYAQDLGAALAAKLGNITISPK